MTAADLLADDEFAGLVFQHWHVAGDERQPNGSPQFVARGAGEDLLDMLLGRQSETFEVRPLKWMRLPCEVCGDAGSVRSHQNGRDITHPCPRGCWPLPRNPFSGMSPRHAYEQARNQTVTVQFDLSAAGIEGAIRDKLIALGWTPPESSAYGVLASDGRSLRYWSGRKPEADEFAERVRQPVTPFKLLRDQVEQGTPGRLVAPDGSAINGRQELVPGTAAVQSATRLPAGGLECEFQGGTRMWWDYAEPRRIGGRAVYVTEEGQEFTEDQLVLVPLQEEAIDGQPPEPP